MSVYSSSPSQKERYWYNPNSRRKSWQEHFWPPRPSHKGFYHYLLGRHCIFLCTEEFHTLGCHANVSQQKVFWKIKPFPVCPRAKNRVSRGDSLIFRALTSLLLMGSLSFCGVGGVYCVGLAMAIGTTVVVMAIKTVMAGNIVGVSIIVT